MVSYFDFIFLFYNKQFAEVDKLICIATILKPFTRFTKNIKYTENFDF